MGIMDVKFHIKLEKDKRYMVAEINGNTYCRLMEPGVPLKMQMADFARQVVKFEKLNGSGEENFQDYMFGKLVGK